MSSDTFVLDLSDYQKPDVSKIPWYKSKRADKIVREAAEKYLNEKARLLSQYIDVSHPIKYSKEREYRPHYSGYMHSQYEPSPTKIPAEYKLNFTIPISICKDVFVSDPKNLDNKCDEYFTEYIYHSYGTNSYKRPNKLTEIDISKYIDTDYYGAIKQIRQYAPFFIIKLIGYIEQKIGTSILDPRLLEISTKIQKKEQNEQWERERPQREADAKKREAEYNCIIIKEKKEKLKQNYKELVTTFVKIQEEQKARYTEIVEMHKQGNEEIPKLTAEYNEKCQQQGGRRRWRGKTAKRERSRKQTIRHHKRRTN